jgi:putative transcriptional regulator
MKRRNRALAIALLSAALAPSTGTYAQPINSLAKGRLLVAREGMIDPNFSRTVVLLVSYDESGAMGIVLNRPSHMQLDHLLPHLDLSSRNLDPVFIGGPVATRRATILFSSSEPPENQSPIIGNVLVTGDLEVLEKMVTGSRPGEQFRVYAGHAGWASGQLEAEILRRGWHVFQATEGDVFTDAEEDLWDKFIRRTRTRIAMR